MICDICGKDIVAANKNAELADGKKAHKDCLVKLKSGIKTIATSNVKRYEKPDKLFAEKIEDIDTVLKENKTGDWKE